MKSVVFFATGALASVSAVVSDLGSISTAVTSLDSSIKSFSGLADRQALIDASQAVVSAINKGASDTSDIGAGSLGVNDAAPLIPPVTALGSTVEGTVSDLIAKKDAFAAVNSCPEVLSQIEAQQSAANGFISSLLGKLAPTLSPVAAPLAASITVALGSASAAFTSCPAGSVSATSTSSGASTTSTGVSSGSVSSSAVSSGSVTSSGVASTITSGSSTVVVVPTGSTGTSSAPMSTGTVVPSNNGVKQVATFGGVFAAAAAIAAAAL